MMEASVYQELMEIKERLARLEEKVDWLIKLYRRNNSKWLQVAFTLWLSFLSVVIGWLSLAR